MTKRPIFIGILICFVLQGLRAQSNIHVAILGDSNTWLGGDSCNNPKGWNKWFKDAFEPTSCRSYARSGATWTNTERTRKNTKENIGILGDDNVIYNQVMRLKEATNEGNQPMPDLIIISAGTNDAWFHAKRPNAFAKTADEAFGVSCKDMRNLPVNKVLTLAEAVRYNCELLMHYYPKAQIVLLTPLQSTAVKTQMINKTGDIIEECSHRMGISVIRQDYECCVYAEREKEHYRYTYDGTHTSVDGARRNGYYIAKKIITYQHP